MGINLELPPRIPVIRVSQWRQTSPLRIAMTYMREGYRYAKGKPKLLLGIYIGTDERGLLWKKQFTFLKTE